MPRQALSLPEVRVVVGLIENPDGHLLVNRRPAGKPLAGLWEFPGGKRRLGEARLAALCRELEEELAIKVIDARPFMILRHAYPDREVELDVWRIAQFSGAPRPAEGQELRWASLTELDTLELLAADAPIVAALRQDRQLSMSPKATS